MSHRICANCDRLVPHDQKYCDECAVQVVEPTEQPKQPLKVVKRPGDNAPIKERLKVMRTKKTGFWWEGKPCHARCLNVRLIESTDFPMYWGNAFVGQVRQAFEMTVPGLKPFFIDNEDGTGRVKIVHGLGSPEIFHRGMIDPEIIDEITDPDKFMPFDIDVYKSTEQGIMKWQKETHPENYAKMMEARKKRTKQS